MSELGEFYGKRENGLVHYERTGNVISITIRGMSNHELRDLIVGLWARLDREDQTDHVRALTHYLEPDSVLPLVSRSIRDSVNTILPGKH